MKVIHYIPSIDRASGGTTAYMQLLASELGRLIELHIVSHESPNPVKIEHCQIHYISLSFLGCMKKEWQELLNKIHPNIIHINCCWMPGCALTQKWAQESGYKVVLTPPWYVGAMDH